MMLSQVTLSDNAGWGAITAFTSMVLVWLAKLLSDRRKDRRDLLLDANKQRALDRIADSNEKIRDAQIEVKTALVHNNEIARLYHEQLLKAVEASCKSPTKIQPSHQH